MFFRHTSVVGASQETSLAWSAGLPLDRLGPANGGAFRIQFLFFSVERAIPRAFFRRGGGLQCDSNV